VAAQEVLGGEEGNKKLKPVFFLTGRVGGGRGAKGGVGVKLITPNGLREEKKGKGNVDTRRLLVMQKRSELGSPDAKWLF